MLEILVELHGHEKEIWSVVWRPGFDELTSCGARQIFLWGREPTNNQWKLKTVVYNEYDTTEERVLLKQSINHETFSVVGAKSADLDSNRKQATIVKSGDLKSVNTGTHERTIRNVGWTSDGQIMAAVSFDATTSIWTQNDRQDWKCVTKIEGHENEVKAVSWSSSCRQLVTCSRDKSIWIHSLASKSKITADNEPEFLCSAVLSGHTQDVKFVCWHPRSDLIISASYDNTIKLWRPWTHEEDEEESDWNCAATLNGHDSTVWCISLSSTGYEFASCSDDKTVRIWTAVLPATFDDQIECKDPKKENALTQEINDAAKDPPSSVYPWLFVNPSFRGLKNKATTHYDQKSQSLEKVVDVSLLEWHCSALISGEHDRMIYSVAWHPALDVIATACGDDSIRLFKRITPPHTNKVETTQWILEDVITSAHFGDVNCISWKPKAEADGGWLLSSCGDDSKIRIFKYWQSSI